MPPGWFVFVLFCFHVLSFLLHLCVFVFPLTVCSPLVIAVSEFCMSPLSLSVCSMLVIAMSVFLPVAIPTHFPSAPFLPFPPAFSSLSPCGYFTRFPFTPFLPFLLAFCPLLLYFPLSSALAIALPVPSARSVLPFPCILESLCVLVCVVPPVYQ